MYNVSVGPSKIVAKTRRGISQNLESFQNLSRKPIDLDSGEVMNLKVVQRSRYVTAIYDLRRILWQTKHQLQNVFVYTPLQDISRGGPRPVFHTNGKKCNNNNKQQEVISPQHEELIRFVSESWSKIFKEYESDGLEDSEAFSTNNSSSIIYYEDPEPNAFLQNFKPFDLESWWGKRLFNNITKSVP